MSFFSPNRTWLALGLALPIATTAGCTLIADASRHQGGARIDAGPVDAAPRDAGTDGQVFDSPQALGVAAGVVGLLGLVPGMPHLVFLIVASGLGLLSWQLVRKRRKVALQPERAVGAEVTPAMGRIRTA